MVRAWLWRDVVALDHLAPLRKVSFEEGSVGLGSSHREGPGGERGEAVRECFGPHDRGDLTMENGCHRGRHACWGDESVDVVRNDTGISLLAECADLRQQVEAFRRG